MLPEQSRAGRALLDMSQTDLAQKAGLGLSTVVDFEKGRRRVSAEAVAALRRALQAAGVVLIDPDLDGAGVRLRRQHDEGLRPEDLNSENDD